MSKSEDEKRETEPNPTRPKRTLGEGRKYETDDPSGEPDAAHLERMKARHQKAAGISLLWIPMAEELE